MITTRVTEARITPLDADGNPDGPTRTIPISSFTLHTTKENTAMPTPNTARPTKAQVAELQAEADRQRQQREATYRELQDAEQRGDRLHTELQELDPEARLVADVEAAIGAYQARLREADERARRANPNQYGYAMASASIGQREPYRPALESPLGRVLLHVAARHDVAIEATVVYPTDPGPTLVSVPPHLGAAVQRMVEMDGFR